MTSTSRKRILLVDDDEHLLVTLRDFLEFGGFAVDVARSGEEGLRKLDISPPDIIVLDIGMPGMGGLGVLKSIGAADGKPRYPVLVLTARSAMKGFFQGTEADGFIEKPCDGNELIRKIQEILARRQAEAARPERPTRPTIVLGEDDPEIADTLSARLIAAGYNVVCSQSGPDVLEKATLVRPQLIVMKQVLSKMNGDRVGSLLHEMGATRDIPILLYDRTGSLQSHRDHSLRMAPGIKHLLATDDPSTLLKAVQAILSVPEGMG